MPAQTLREALNALDPEQALSTEELLDQYFVPRPASPIEDLRFLLEDANTPQKVLFTGHRGSGKSTELAKLSQGLDGAFRVVRYSARSLLNLYDLTYVDVLLSLGLELIRSATNDDLGLNTDLLQQIGSFAQEVSRETESGYSDRGEAGVELNLWAVKLAGKLGTEVATRVRVRENVQYRISDLLENIELLVQELERVDGRRVLAIVEDLDKINLETARQLFYQYAVSMLAPALSVIYTFPTALRHDNDFIQVEAGCPNVYILPNLKPERRDGSLDQAGLDSLREILIRRVDAALFTPDALTQLAELSSGIPRELIALSRQASLEARKRQQSVIDEVAVAGAARRRRNDYQVLLTSEQLELLARIRQSKRVENDEGHRALLHNLSALEFRNDDIWYDVHPLVRPLLPSES
jgi:hypothetical protein